MHVVTYDIFDKYVTEGINAIPKEFRKEFNNLAFVIENYPTPYQQRKIAMRKGSIIFGLYEGVPLQRRNSGYTGVLPDKISIFKKPIEYFSRDEEHLRKIVKNTVWHEVAHHFGMNEAEVRKAERDRGHKY